jgi:hypothetical protein
MLIFLFLSIICFFLNYKVLLFNEDLLIFTSVFLTILLINTFLRKNVVSTLFSKSMSYYGSFQRIFLLNILLLNKIHSIINIFTINYNNFDYLIDVSYNIIAIYVNKIFINILKKN